MHLVESPLCQPQIQHTHISFGRDRTQELAGQLPSSKPFLADMAHKFGGSFVILRMSSQILNSCEHLPTSMTDERTRGLFPMRP